MCLKRRRLRSAQRCARCELWRDCLRDVQRAIPRWLRVWWEMPGHMGRSSIAVFLPQLYYLSKTRKSGIAMRA